MDPHGDQSMSEGLEQAEDGTIVEDAQYYEQVETGGQDVECEYSEMEPQSPLRDQDRFLPIANVSKIMKKSVPHTGKIARDAKECIQECVSEFISFITSEAAERCQQEKRKTINGEDLLFAMNTLGFDNYVEPLKVFLQKYREANKVDISVIEEPGIMDELTGNVTGSIFSTAASSSSKNSRRTQQHRQQLQVPQQPAQTVQVTTVGVVGEQEQAQQTVYVPVTFINGNNESQPCDSSSL